MEWQAWEENADILMKQLADGTVGTLPPLTERQEALGIDKSLAYMASIVLEEGRTPPYTKQEQDAFARLQILYHKHHVGTSPPKLFHLTPAMAPTVSIRTQLEAQLEASEAALAAVNREQAEHNAKIAMKELLLEEVQEEEKQARKTIRRLKRKQRRMASKGGSNDDDKENDDVEKSDVSSVEDDGKETPNDVLEGDSARSPSLGVRHVNEDDSLNDSDDWIEVKKKKNKTARAMAEPIPSETNSGLSEEAPTDESTVEEVTDVAEPPLEGSNHPQSSKHEVTCDNVEQTEEKLTNSAEISLGSTSSPPPVDQHDARCDDTSKSLSVPVEKALPIENASAVAPTMTTTEEVSPTTVDAVTESSESNETTDHDTTVKMLQARVKLLEEELLKKDQQLEAERKEHQAKLERELRNEREASLTRLQALQLRLYISNVRLHTLEDALAQHVKAVSHLAPAQGITPLDETESGDVTTEDDDATDSCPSTPLYSRLAAMRSKKSAQPEMSPATEGRNGTSVTSFGEEGATT